jgi:hypothetical protein
MIKGTSSKSADDWPRCIVSYIDMCGIKRLLAKQSEDAVSLLRNMHSVVENMGPQLKHHEEICLWNDSVLLLGLISDIPDSCEKIMKEVSSLKEAVDKVNRCYVISVKGQIFPPPNNAKAPTSLSRPRLLYLRASSLAFSNCFSIEEEAKKRGWRKDWYIDDRIIRKIPAREADKTHMMELFPRSRKCRVHMYKGSFWRFTVQQIKRNE